eukprot:7522276-Alexandrium_andersonii.AAC.1
MEHGLVPSRPEPYVVSTAAEGGRQARSRGRRFDAPTACPTGVLPARAPYRGEAKGRAVVKRLDQA